MKISPAYLAGVMDSDGSFSITKRHAYRINCNYTCMIQLTWTDSPQSKEFMQLLVDKFGGSHFTGQPSGTSNYPNTKPVIKYCATGAAAHSLVNYVLLDLNLKREQAENILLAIEQVKNAKWAGSPRPTSVTEALEALYLRNRSLNSKNGTLCA